VREREAAPVGAQTPNEGQGETRAQACKTIAHVKQADRRRRPVYVLRLQSPGGDDIRRLRLLLKALLRRYGLRCLGIEEVRR
jgi:hypothetical protein